MNLRRLLRITRIAAACALLAAPMAVRADPISIFIAAEAAFGATATGVLATLASYAGYIAMGANLIYGAMDARRRAAHAQADARNAFNSGLTDRFATVLQADPAWRVVYGQCRTGGDIVAIFSSDKQGTRTDGSTYTKPDGLKHLVIVVAAHEVEDIPEMYLDGVALGALDGNGWASSGDAAKVQTYTREVQIAAGGSAAFAGAVTMLGTWDSAGYSVSGGSGDIYWVGGVVTYSLSGDSKTITNTSAFTATFSLTYSASPGTVRWSKHLGTTTQAADSYLLATVPSQWTAADQLKGNAYVVVTLDLEDQRFQGGPPGMTWDVKGRKLFDPRTGSTTWSANPALVVRDYLTAAWGLECAAGDIDDSYTIAAANACAATISLTEDTTTTTGQATYTCNGAVLSSDSRERVLSDLCDSMAGYAVYGARWQIMAGAWTTPVLALTDNDLDGQVEIVQAAAGLDEVFNGVRGSYAPVGSAATSDFSYANATFVAADGRELWTEVQLAYTNGAARCRNLARTQVEANRDSQVIRFPAKLTAWPLQVGDRVTVTNAEYGWSAKTYRVTDWQFGLSSPVVLTLQEDAAAIYDQADAASADPAPNTGLPSPWNVPSLSGVDAASGNANLAVMIDGTINVRMKVTWSAVTSAYVADGSGQIIVRWRSPRPKQLWGTTNAGDSADLWRAVTVPGDATSAWIDNLTPGDLITISVTAVNGLGVSSAAVVISRTVVGKTVAPATVAGLAYTVVQGGVRIDWTPSTEPAYATTQLRVGSAWSSAASLYVGAARPWLWAWPAAGIYTVLAKHFDSAGNESAAAASISVTVDSSMLLTRSELATELGKSVDLIAPINAALGNHDLNLTALASAVALLSLNANSIAGVLSGAGIYSDPVAGTVKIAAIEQTNATLSTVAITLAAHTSAINLRATTTYVDGQIASAVLGGATVVFTALDTRLTAAEVSISGLTAGIALKADVTTVNSQGARLTTAETNISGLTGTVALKADSTTVTAINTRVTTAETSITALGSQASAVTDLQAGTFRLTNNAAAGDATTLAAVLAIWQATQTLNTALAVAHEEITTKVNGDVGAEAIARLLLAARVAGAEAAILTEQLTRASADSATASIITTLQARLNSGGDIASAIASTTTTATTAVINAATAQGTANTANSAAGAAQATANTAVSNAAAAQGTATTALGNAATAQTAADAANTALTNIASDNILSPSEKPSVVQDYAVITAEQSGIDAQASVYSITTEKTAYDSAVSSLTSYLAGLTGWNTIPGADVAVAGATFRGNFTAVYAARQVLLNRIANAAKVLADAAQGTANTAVTNAAAAQGTANTANSAAGAAQTTANAAASAITTLQARLTTGGDIYGSIATVQTQASATASSVTGLNSQWTLKAQTVRSDGQVVLGAIGVASASNSAGSQSEIILAADKLTFVSSSSPNAATTPLLTTGMVNGSPALIIGAAVIGDATIRTLHLVPGAVSANVNASNSLSIPSLPNSSATYTTSAIAAGSLTASGGYVSAQATVSVRAHAGSASVASAQIFAKLYRNGTQVGASTWFGRAAQYPDPVGTGQALATEFTLTHPLLTLTGSQAYTVDVAIQFRDASGSQINPFNASVTSYLQVDTVCNLQEIKV